MYPIRTDPLLSQRIRVNVFVSIAVFLDALRLRQFTVHGMAVSCILYLVSGVSVLIDAGIRMRRIGCQWTWPGRWWESVEPFTLWGLLLNESDLSQPINSG